jgi:hypothetical protein
MSAVGQRLRGAVARRRRRRARLPWKQLEAEATRQGCSPADIFFDRAGRSATADPGADSGWGDSQPVPGTRASRGTA